MAVRSVRARITFKFRVLFRTKDELVRRFRRARDLFGPRSRHLSKRRSKAVKGSQ